MEHIKDFVNFLDRYRKKEKVAWDIFVEKYGNLIYQYIIKTLRRYYYSYQDDVTSLDDFKDRYLVPV